jgi:HPt (histidine-containing phosphotransfer) domain-containing protein
MSTPTDPLLDVEALVDFVDGDLELLDELAGTFVDSIPGWRSALRAAVDQGDAEATFRAAHGLSGAAAALKATATQRAAAELEAMGRDKVLAGAATVLERLETDLVALAQLLKQSPWRTRG